MNGSVPYRSLKVRKTTKHTPPPSKRTLLQRRVNSTSKRPSMGATLRRHTLTQLTIDPRVLLPELKSGFVCCFFFFLSTKKALIIHNASLHSSSTYSPFRFESVYGEKNALERGKKNIAFLPPPFLLPMVSGCHAAL